MSLKADEDEHSIEMHLPYVAKVMESQLGNFTIVPILVGSLSTENEKIYGKLLAKYLADSESVFIVSSDFCHWGSRFHYTFYEKSWGDIHESIDKLDHMGMDIIETISPGDFTSYLKKYGNTICGRHPIAVLLNVSCLWILIFVCSWFDHCSGCHGIEEKVLRNIYYFGKWSHVTKIREVCTIIPMQISTWFIRIICICIPQVSRRNSTS